MTKKLTQWSALSQRMLSRKFIYNLIQDLNIISFTYMKQIKSSENKMHLQKKKNNEHKMLVHFSAINKDCKSNEFNCWI